MRCRMLLIPIILLLALSVVAREKKPAPPTPAELAAITTRGRALYEYERAVWNARAALKSLNAPSEKTRFVIGQETPGGWVTGTGTLNEKKDTFLVSYEITSSGPEGKLSVRTIDPPKADESFYRVAAAAIETAQADFHAQSRPYNAAVVPAEESQVYYVYLYPAITRPGVIPLGGDVRYRIGDGGKKIIERRDLHKTILETTRNVPGGTKVVGGIHSHVLTDLPEDTDVLHVLLRQLPESIGAGGRVYMIAEDGTIRMIGK